MIKINKNLRDWLVNEKKIKCGEGGICRTYGKSKTYYLTESKKNLALVEEYNNLVRVSKN